MTTVTLKNGTEAFTPLVAATMVNIRTLMKDNRIAAYELVQVCRNPQHQPFGNAGDVLTRRGLMDSGGGVHDSIRNIVLSSVDGDGADMRFTSPVAEEAR